MSGKTDLSIIIPVYNGEKFIKNIVNEILELNSRSNIDLELLLIDDGSSDKSAAICNDLSEGDGCIRYYHKENGGIASARNYGLEKAKGEYVTFADQDDLIISSYEPFLKRCNEEHLDILITSPYSKRHNSEKMNKRTFTDEVIDNKVQIRRMAGKLIDGKYLSDDSAQFVSTSVWNAIYRREMLINNGIEFKSFIDYEDDWIFNLESLIAANKIAVSSEGYYCWNIRESSESHRKKYIPALAEKRSRWMVWMDDILDLMKISDEKKNKFIQNVLIPRNIIICFNNACWNPDSTKTEAVKEIKDSNSLWGIETVDLSLVDEMDRSNKLLLWLLYHNKINIAYDFNRKVLGKRFH